jgi:hypothetical protein
LYIKIDGNRSQHFRVERFADIHTLLINSIIDRMCKRIEREQIIRLLVVIISSDSVEQ